MAKNRITRIIHTGWWLCVVGLLVVGIIPARAQDTDLQVWAQEVHTEDIGWRIEYRDGKGSVLASFDLPSYPLLYPDNHTAGRLIGTDQQQIFLFTPYIGIVEALPVPDMPADFGDDYYMITMTALRPDDAWYAYNINHQPADYEDPADTRIYIATPHAGDDQLIFEEQHTSYLAVEPVAWSADGSRLLLRTMPQGIGGYILFMSHQDARILDIATGATQLLGDIDGYSANFEWVAMLEWSDSPVPVLAVTDVTSGAITRYPLPDIGESPQTGGGAVFSADNRFVAYQVARHDPNNEKFWTIVVDRETGESRVVLEDTGASFQMQYGYIGAWVNDLVLTVGDIWSGNTAFVNVMTGEFLGAESDHIFLGYATGLKEVIGFATTPVPPQSCPGSPIQRLQVGQMGIITFTDGTLTNVRDAPDTTGSVIASLPEGATFRVLDGPVCAGNYSWWMLEFPNGLSGWVAEGDPGAYWLEPYP